MTNRKLAYAKKRLNALRNRCLKFQTVCPASKYVARQLNEAQVAIAYDNLETARELMNDAAKCLRQYRK